MMNPNEIDYSRLLTDEEMDQWAETFRKCRQDVYFVQKYFPFCRNPWFLRFMYGRFLHDADKYKRFRRSKPKKKDPYAEEQINKHELFFAEGLTIHTNQCIKKVDNGDLPDTLELRLFYQTEIYTFECVLSLDPESPEGWDTECVLESFRPKGRRISQMDYDRRVRLQPQSISWLLKKTMGLFVDRDDKGLFLASDPLQGVLHEEDSLKELRKKGLEDKELCARISQEKESLAKDYLFEICQDDPLGLSESDWKNYWHIMQQYVEHGELSGFQTFPKFIQTLQDLGTVKEILLAGMDLDFSHKRCVVWSADDNEDVTFTFDICNTSGIHNLVIYQGDARILNRRLMGHGALTFNLMNGRLDRALLSEAVDVDDQTYREMESLLDMLLESCLDVQPHEYIDKSRHETCPYDPFNGADGEHNEFPHEDMGWC
jgi:hypothetical protein